MLKSRSSKGSQVDREPLSRLMAQLHPREVCVIVHLDRALEDARALATVETVLSVGSISMRTTMCLAATHPEIDFVTVSTDADHLDRLVGRAQRYGIHNLTVRDHDLQRAPTAAGDLVMCGPLLERCVDDAAIARHLFASTGALLQLEVHLASPKDHGSPLAVERANGRGLARPGYTPASLRALFPGCGVVSLRSALHVDTLAELDRGAGAISRIAAHDLREELVYSRREARSLMALIDVRTAGTTVPDELARVQEDGSARATTSAPARLSQVLEALAPGSYLEIGVDDDERRHRIPADAVRTALRWQDDSLVPGRVMVGGAVDVTSDAPFDDAVDFVFIDGSRVFEYILRDVARAIPHCHQRSVIAVRYTMPDADWLVTRGRARRWCGDAWKVLPWLAEIAPEISVVTIETPDGGLSLLSGFLPSHAGLADAIPDAIDRYGTLPPESFPDHRSCRPVVANRWADIERALPLAFGPADRHEPLAPDRFGFPLAPPAASTGPIGFAVELIKRAVLGEFDRAAAPFADNRARARARKQSAGPLPLASRYTMLGAKKTDHLHTCVEAILAEGVPGDFVETGVWRGGACILMRGILKAHGDDARTVWVADSFAGLPPPDAERFPADSLSPLHTYDQLAVSLAEVQENFRRFGLLDQQVRFLPGWFSETLPDAPIGRLALMRLDGDMYESTWDAIVNLYPRLSTGGFVIVDDYGTVPGCREAILDYRSQHDITDPIQFVVGLPQCVYWRRS
ncbi:MAG: macrocin-O-methyltransferase [Acidimicrobiales bacterium]|nr:macrocin-O-methyltransferase [Acidimicrobiales bacterium]